MMGESGMERDTQTMTDMYQVHCTECGERIENKFFPLNKLLGQYNVGDETVRELVEFLGIGALYGQTVLPDVPPLVDREGNWNFQKPSSFAGQALPAFECPDNEIPMEKLRPVNLNIASMVAQFCMITGFTDIYPMLALRHKMDNAEDDLMSGLDITEDEKRHWGDYCNALSHIPGVMVDPLSTDTLRRQQIGQYLSEILNLAEREAKTPARKHFAAQELIIGWRYKELNGRAMPYSLVARGALEGSFDALECCCDKCRRPLSWEMGAYEQKVIGILGTQAAGKTTYLMALADVIPQVKFEKMTLTPASGDPQWDRVKNVKGLLWKYQHGYAPEKTAVQEGMAPALTFLVKKDEASEPVMYTLADIPGEVFYNQTDLEFSQSQTDTIKKLLLASDSLMMIVNSDQLRGQEGENTPENGGSSLVKDSAKILDAFKKFLPKKPISTAVVLTAADKLGDLRKLLGLAYDIRRVKPMVGGEIYNTEVMDTASQAVGEYMDRNFNQFLHNLKNGFVPSGSQVEAFLVSSGAQCARQLEAEIDEAADKARYEKMCQERFGVAAPLLWLLCCDGLLEQGRGDEDFTHYDEKYRSRILAEMTRKER